MVGGFVSGVAGGGAVVIVIRAVDKFSSVLKGLSARLGKFGKVAALAFSAIGVAAVTAGVAMAAGISEAIKLETAMVGVAKTTGLAGDQLKELELGFRELSKTIPISATELATIGAVAGQLGIEGVENIKSFTEVASKMAIATELTAEQAALSLAKISNAFGLPIDEAEKLGSAINELSNISAASSSEIASALVRVASSAAPLGLSADVVSGLTAALIASGEPAERAGTKLRSAFDQVIKKLRDVSEFMGEDFKKALEKDANGAMLSLIKRISEIESPVERQQTALDLFGQVGASAINKIASNIPEMTRLIEASSKEFENATSLQREFEIASASTANQIQLLKNRVIELLLNAFQPMLPLINKVVDSLSGIIERATTFAAKAGPALASWLSEIGTAIKAGFSVVDIDAFKNIVKETFQFIRDNKETIITTFMNFAKFIGIVFNIFVKLVDLLIKAGALKFILFAFSQLAKILNVIAEVISFVVGQVRALVKFLSAAIGSVASLSNKVLSGFGLGKKIFGLAGLQSGGIVTRPTLSLLGEAGPEAVIPLNKAGGLGGNITVIVEGSILSESDLAENVAIVLQDRLNNLQKAF